MTTQEQAHEQAQQLGDIRRASGEAMTDEAFGRINFLKFHAAFAGCYTTWDRIEENERQAWIASAAAVRKADAELREAKP